jgi:iron complex outermembrane receptor protein
VESSAYLTTAPPREKLILQGFWTKGPWSVNLRETVYNDMSEYINSPPILQTIPATGITDLDVGYQFTHNLRIDLGANNLFNTIPPTIGLLNGQPADGNYVYRQPQPFAPWGQNGGYYYGRVVLTY